VISDPRIVFTFIGGGHPMDELERIVKSPAPDASFRFVPYQDRVNLRRARPDQGRRTSDQGLGGG
jgi:hypothetical protein